MPLPTILLIHGAWHTPDHYAGYITALQEKGFTVHAPHLPSCNPSFQPDGKARASLPDDIHAVRESATSLSEKGEKVLMIMHSYGGVVGTDAVEGLGYHCSTPDTPKTEDRATGGVIHLLYPCAYILAPRIAVWDIVRAAGFDKLWDEHIATDARDMIFPRNPAAICIEDALGKLVPFPMSALTTPISSGKKIWEEVPVTYVSTKRDYAVPGVYQDIMLANVKEAGVDVKIVEVDGCHSVFVEKTMDMVDVAVGAAGDERNLSLGYDVSDRS
ncbi:hypothetical protein BDV12DRAFT_191198 [Aspergillus spectabilis]